MEHITSYELSLIINYIEYIISMPNMYARGILFGKMVLELGDSCSAKNERTGMACDLDFKTKVIHVLYVL